MRLRSHLSRRRLLAGGVVGSASLLFATGVRVRSVDVIAHRGFAAERPENTLEAVRYAIPRADGIEVDVRRCGSGELVCVHDETLERLTDGAVTDRVGRLDWERLQTVSIGSSDARVPQLADVLEAVPPDVRLNIELKERGLAPDLLGLLEEFDGRALVSSFDPTALWQVQSLTDGVALAYIFGDDPDRGLERAADLECAAVHPSAGLCRETEIVDRAHDRGFAVNAWTVDSGLETARLALTGVDGVFSDVSLPGL
ncbi:glycerophosphodiester phosphodiesterase [Halopiger xanaduensis]|uniref:Glycerophosphoryl diester phosphodiesterase n=1 Tax=Halopiger xanaduensis (strain DSM 18323 / JCM 14033 / SH-6) TaxID=797210 RepID=F8DA09_HALXS|nr:glycerophosphodiester phosphodiesterase [Halopiger xanaduensis]AEH36925.1 glycerophosphoryl diester phosphodiesterase [Halopiger xanaduensis SH-6]